MESLDPQNAYESETDSGGESDWEIDYSTESEENDTKNVSHGEVVSGPKVSELTKMFEAMISSRSTIPSENSSHIYKAIEDATIELNPVVIVECPYDEQGENDAMPVSTLPPDFSALIGARRVLVPLFPQEKYKNPMDIVAELGTFKKLNSDAEITELIKSYAENSINFNQDSDQAMKLKVNGIHKFKTFNSQFRSSGKISKPGEPLSKNAKQSSSKKGFQMYLWYKTDQDSVHKLGSSESMCLPFYDRVRPTLPVISVGSRQTLLLCKVSLGHMYKSKEGFSRWNSVDQPPIGHNSIKGTGKFRPNWETNHAYKGAIVPCGETVQNPRYTDYELNYNEYLVFNKKQVKVCLVVVLEFCEDITQ